MKFLPLILLISFGVQVNADNLLSSDHVAITDKELEFYLNDRLPPDSKNISLTQDKTYKESLENIFLIKHFAALAKSKSGLTPEQKWVAELERERVLMKFYISDYIEKQLSAVDWDAMAKEEYVANKDSYATKERVSASHILVKSSTRGDVEAKQLADEIYAKLQKGEDFGALVSEYSEDKGSKSSGGALGYFEKQAMVKQFAEAAFAMTEEGQLSKPVKTIYGYHIVRFDGRKKAGFLSFEEVSKTVVKQRKKQLRQKLHKDLIFATKSSGEFSIDLEGVAKLKESLEKKYPLPKIR